jgi:UDP-glucose 4-epimerase
MKSLLIAGSNGFYGRIIKSYLKSSSKFEVVTVDIINPDCDNVSNFEGDVNKLNLNETFKNYRFDTIIHLASDLDFSSSDQASLYRNNVQATRNLLNFALSNNARKIIFTSSNSIFLGDLGLDINEQTPTKAIDSYGLSKVESERILLERSSEILINILRCPIIIDHGRVGILSILFDLVRSNSNLWVLGTNNVKHDVLYAGDLNSAINILIENNISGVYNLSSGEPVSFEEIYKNLIHLSGSKSKIRFLPQAFVKVLKILYSLKLSPLGPYQLNMLTNNFSFNVDKAKLELGWLPTENARTLFALAYKKYCASNDIEKGRSNSGSVRQGVLSFLKYIKF